MDSVVAFLVSAGLGKAAGRGPDSMEIAEKVLGLRGQVRECVYMCICVRDGCAYSSEIRMFRKR